MARNVINVNNHDVIQKEAVAGGVITPGMLIAIASTAKCAAHAVENGVTSLRIALEDTLQGKTISDNYAADDIVRYMVARPGDEFNGLLPAGAAAVVIGDKLISSGDGTFKKASPTETKAHVHTGVVGNNNAILWTAKLYGYEGNGIEIKLVDPFGNDQSLSVSVTGKVITVNLATGGAGAITSTPTTIIAAILASAAASALVTAANDGASTGAAAVVAADVYTAGGVDGQGEDHLVEAVEAVDNSIGATPARCLMVAR